MSPGLKPAEHAAAVRLSLALEQIAKEDGLGALAVHFLAVSEDERIETLPFLAASRMLADGYGYAGEGDVACAALVATLQRIAGPASFTEMFAMDFDDKSVLMAHMGEANYAMARPDRKPLLTKRSFKLAPTKFDPATPCFSLAPGPATLGSLSVAPEGRFRLVISEGEVADWGPFPAMETPHFKFAPKTAFENAIEAWSRAGGSHHQAICRGHRAELLACLAEAVGMEAVTV
jgi:L-arabinose isomerase